MTIKQLGGVFGRNPTFNDVTIEGTLTFDGAIDITSDLTIEDNLYVLGSVGIGTTTPARLLELETTTANESYLRISGTSGNVADTNFAGIEFYNLDSSAAGPNVASFIEARAQTSTGAGGELVFATLPSTASEGDRAIERLRIDADGNVGIGESSPTFDVQIRRAAEVNLGLSYTGQTTSELAAEASAVTALKSSGNLRFVTNTSTEAMRIDNSGRVGISETNPSANLHISTNNTSTTNTATIRLEDTDTTQLGNQGIGRIEFYGNDSSGAGAGVKASIEAFGEDGSGRTTLKFSTANAVANDVGAMYINSSGQVGIGTDSPAAKLDTAYTDTATYSATSPSADLILSRKNTGNTANETVGIRFDITGWSGSTTGGAAIEAIQPSNASTADLAFLTRDAGTWGERLRITSNGSVGIGTDSPTRKLHVNDESNSIVGRFSSGQTSTWAQFASNSTGTASRIGSPTDDAVASIALITRDQERLRIDADGHVIIPEGVTLGTAAGTYNADNTLDDYEEGTWTPTVFGQTTAGTYTLTDGGSTYTKVGRKVTVIAKIRDITEVSAGVGNLNIGGLPFAVSVVGQGALRFNTLDVANDSINFSVENYVTSTVYISESKDNASGSVTGLSAITSGTTDIFFTLTYFA